MYVLYVCMYVYCMYVFVVYVYICMCMYVWMIALSLKQYRPVLGTSRKELQLAPMDSAVQWVRLYFPLLYFDFGEPPLSSLYVHTQDLYRK